MSDRSLRERDYLGHMLDAVRQIQTYTLLKRKAILMPTGSCRMR